MSDYNGYRNRETWLVHLWYNPESLEDVENARVSLEEDIERVAESLPPHVKDLLSPWEQYDQIAWYELENLFKDKENE